MTCLIADLFSFAHRQLSLKYPFYYQFYLKTFRKDVPYILIKYLKIFHDSQTSIFYMCLCIVCFYYCISLHVLSSMLIYFWPSLLLLQLLAYSHKNSSFLFFFFLCFPNYIFFITAIQIHDACCTILLPKKVSLPYFQSWCKYQSGFDCFKCKKRAATPTCLLIAFSSHTPSAMYFP